MSFSLVRYEAACREYREKWEAVDDALYGLCRAYPDHTNKAGVYAKLTIIGRSYMTGIERQVENTDKMKQSGSINRLGEHFWKNRAQIDAILDTLHGLSEPLDEAKLGKIIAVHSRLLQEVKARVRSDRTPRSFASKYLHFHCPAVPMIDTYAVRGLNELRRGERLFAVLDVPQGADEMYGCFASRFWGLYEDAQSSGARISVKLLDYYLLATAQEAP